MIRLQLFTFYGKEVGVAVQTVLHFLELHHCLRHHEINTPIKITVEKLAGVWHCTPRYVKAMIRKLCELGWIEWQAGVGRGNHSVLTLCIDSDGILQDEVKERMERGDVKDAMELMSRFGGASVKEHVMSWLSEGMGFTTKTVSDRLQDTLRLPVYRTILTLDPAQLYYSFDSHIAAQIFNTLVEYDKTTRTVTPCLAHAWESQQQAREWIFHLRKGIMFHHGRELTARDVVFSLDRFRQNPALSQSGWLFQGIEELEAIDHVTVRIRLRESDYLFLHALSTVYASILPEEVVRQQADEFASNPVGTGPFRLVRFNEGVCILEAFPLHFRGRPHLDRVEILIFPDMEEGCLKEPDWTSVMASDGDTTGQQQEPDVSAETDWCDIETLYSCCSLLVFNQWKTGPQNHPKFRQALNLMLDRQQLVADLRSDMRIPASGFHSQLPNQVDQAKASPEEIKALLEESGYGGEIVHMTSNSFHEAEAAWIKDRCASYGVNLEVVIENIIPGVNDQSVEMQFDCRLFGYIFNHDEITELELYVQPNYLLAAFDEDFAAFVKETVQAIRREPDASERQRKFDMLEEQIKQSNSILILIHKKSNTCFHKSVRGVTLNAFGWLDFYKIWFQRYSNG
ncbi:UNVERIFIED_CONTAM: SgrR family transcriptional regulator [Brevibacillus sp. OAP136]